MAFKRSSVRSRSAPPFIFKHALNPTINLRIQVVVPKAFGIGTPRRILSKTEFKSATEQSPALTVREDSYDDNKNSIV